MPFSLAPQWLDCVGDLLADEAVRSMDAFPHHRPGFSCYRHCLWVSYTSFVCCSALGWNAREAARGGLLHDLYLYNWVRQGPGGFFRHLLDHPRLALEHAKARFPLTKREEDIIRSHMFPISTVRHHYRESAVVATMDKLCALAEVAGLTPKALRTLEPDSLFAAYPVEKEGILFPSIERGNSHVC